MTCLFVGHLVRCLGFWKSNLNDKRTYLLQNGIITFCRRIFFCAHWESEDTNTGNDRRVFVLPYMVSIQIWDVVRWGKGMDVTATLFLLGGRLGKSRVCEVGHEVLCQIYADF